MFNNIFSKIVPFMR